MEQTPGCLFPAHLQCDQPDPLHPVSNIHKLFYLLYAVAVWKVPEYSFQFPNSGMSLTGFHLANPLLPLRTASSSLHGTASASHRYWQNPGGKYHVPVPNA